MANITLTPAWTGYKSRPTGRDAAGAWTQGTLRAGVLNGQKYISAVLFTFPSDFPGVQRVTSAGLALVRDGAWGTDTRAVQLFPIPMQGISGTETEEESLARGAVGARKEYTTGAGENALNIAGAALGRMQAGTCRGFLLMTEDGGSYSQFTDAVTLTVTIMSYTDAPVWTRGIGAGDVISDARRWHTEDVDELIYYLNTRQKADGLDTFTWPEAKRGLFAGWGECMSEMQTKLNECLTAEGLEARTFTAVAAGDYPKAIIINELRLTLENSGGYAAKGARYAYYKKGAGSQSWKDGDVVGGGKKVSEWHYEYEEYVVGGTSYEKIKKVWTTTYYYYAGYWIFQNITSLRGKALTGVTVRIRKISGENTFKLYGTALAEPDTGKKVTEIFTDASDAAGYVEVTMADGEERDVALPDTMVAALQAGTIQGLGLKPGGTVNTKLSAAATLYTDISS